MILPFLILLYLGGVELTHAITVDRKVTAATSTVGDLVAQATKVSNGDLNNIFNAASAILAPYNAASLRIVVSSVEVTDNGGIVRWSAARNGSCHEAGAALTLPAGVTAPGTWLIVAEAQYLYETAIGKIITDSITLSETFYLRPRAAEDVEGPQNPTC